MQEGDSWSLGKALGLKNGEKNTQEIAPETKSPAPEEGAQLLVKRPGMNAGPASSCCAAYRNSLNLSEPVKLGPQSLSEDLQGFNKQHILGT